MQILGDFQPSVRRALEEIDPKYDELDALVICGTHSPQDEESLIAHIKHARETGRPYYGECYGHQLAAIESARNVLGIPDATSEEFGQGTFVVKKRPAGLNVGLREGESYWNNYEVIIDWDKPKNFFTAQFHASYQSSIDKPHPLIKSFLTYAKRNKYNEDDYANL